MNSPAFFENAFFQQVFNIMHRTFPVTRPCCPLFQFSRSLRTSQGKKSQHQPGRGTHAVFFDKLRVRGDIRHREFADQSLLHQFAQALQHYRTMYATGRNEKQRIGWGAGISNSLKIKLRDQGALKNLNSQLLRLECPVR